MSAFLDFLDANKTKLTGAVIAALAFLQASDALPSLLSESAYKWTMVVAGLVVVFLGYLNNPDTGDEA